MRGTDAADDGFTAEHPCPAGKTVGVSHLSAPSPSFLPDVSGIQPASHALSPTVSATGRLNFSFFFPLQALWPRWSLRLL